MVEWGARGSAPDYIVSRVRVGTRAGTRARVGRRSAARQSLLPRSDVLLQLPHFQLEHLRGYPLMLQGNLLGLLFVFMHSVVAAEGYHFAHPVRFAPGSIDAALDRNSRLPYTIQKLVAESGSILRIRVRTH